MSDIKATSRLVVGNLPKTLTKDSDLKKAILDILAASPKSKEYDFRITDCAIIFTKASDTKPSISRRFSFVGFKDEETATAALSILKHAYITTKKLNVSYAYTKNDVDNLPKSLSEITQKKLGISLQSSKKEASEARIKDNEKTDILAQTKALKRAMLTEEHLNQFNAVASGANNASIWGSESVDNIDYLKNRGAEWSEDESESEESDENTIIDNKRVFIVKLPKEVEEDDLKQFAGSVGVVEDVKIMTDPSTKLPIGTAYISFFLEESVQKFIDYAKTHPFHGSIIEPMIAKTYRKMEIAAGFKSKRKAQQKETSMTNPSAWNSLYMSSSAVASSLAASAGVSVADITAADSNAAVNIALAEVNITETAAQFLADNGIDASNIGVSASTRSDRIILMKNVPQDVQADHLRALIEVIPDVRYDLIEGPFVPKIFIAKFYIPSDAKAVYRRIILKKIGAQKTPLILEWAPILKQEVKTEQFDKILVETYPVQISGWKDDITEAELTDIIKNAVSLRGILRVTIPKKDGKSLPYAFIDCETEKIAGDIVKASEKGWLRSGDRVLAAKLSVIKKQSENENLPDDQRPRLMIRNIPFTSNKNELRSFFSGLGNMVSLRVPQKFDGTSRGFAFVEYSSISEASNVLNRLKSVHLNGRRLVAEWANNVELDGSQKQRRE